SVGQSTNFTITLNSQDGETGSVSLQCSNLPSGATCAFNPSAPALPANGSVTDQLSVQVSSTAQVGTYPLTVTATVGTITHQIAATLQIQPPPAFSGSINPGSATLSVAQSANFNITLNSQYGATGSVSFQCLNVPSGTACTFNPTTVNLPANGNAADTLTVQVNSQPAIAPPLTSIPWTSTVGRLGTLRFLAGLLFATLVIIASTGGR